LSAHGQATHATSRAISPGDAPAVRSQTGSAHQMNPIGPPSAK
jgi:hypothetical protein